MVTQDEMKMLGRICKNMERDSLSGRSWHQAGNSLPRMAPRSAPNPPPSAPNPPQSAPHPPNYWYQWEAVGREPEKSRFDKIFEGEEKENIFVENLIVNVIQAKNKQSKYKAEQKLKKFWKLLKN